MIVVHHAKKGGGSQRAGQTLRGSSEFHAWGDSNLYLARRASALMMQVEHRAAPSIEDLRLELRSDTRTNAPALEIVASVDGLDVQDGKSASFQKRGYILQPGKSLEIEGFRTSYDKVASFKFSGVANSYANLRHGDTRNVGVIGIAVFTQKNVDPWEWMPREVDRRDTARPFATAP